MEHNGSDLTRVTIVAMNPGSRRQDIAREAKAIVALASEMVRSSRFMRDASAHLQWPRRLLPNHGRRNEVIMTNAVNKVYKMLLLKTENPEEYERQIQFRIALHDALG